MHQRAALRGAAALLAAILLLGTAGCGAAAPETAATVPPTPLPAEEPEHAGECRILAEPSEEDGGTVTGGGIFAVGDKVTLTAHCAGGWAFAGWSHWGKIVSTAAVYTFTADRTAIYTAVFLPVGVPETTLFETDFEGAEPGPVEIGDWSGPFSYLAEECAWRLEETEDGLVLAGTTFTENGRGTAVLRAPAVDKEVTFDFRYDGDFFDWGGIFFSMHRKAGEGSYYFSMNPNFMGGRLIVSTGPTNLGACDFEYRQNTWYSVRCRMFRGVMSVKLWERDTEEPEDWTLVQALAGYDPTAEDAEIAVELFNFAAGNPVNVEFDNLTVRVWETEEAGQ